MEISRSTRKIHRREKTAKAVIWGLSALTIFILFWIIGFILIRGFYSNKEVRYDFTGYTEETIPLDDQHGVIFVAHSKLRIKDITTEDLQTLYTSPIRELNTWGDFTGQDIYCKPAVYLEPSEFNSAVQKLLLGNSALDDWKSYTVKKNSSEEILEYVGNTPGGLGYIPAEDAYLIDKKVQIIPVRDMVLQVNPSVTDIVNNRSLQAVTMDQLNSILRGDVANWNQIDGPELPLVLGLSSSINLSEQLDGISHSVTAMDSRASMLSFLEHTPGALLMSRFGDIDTHDFELLSVDRIERGRNLTLAFILEKPAGGDAGGISYFIINTLILIILTLLFSTPVGVMAAIYLVEYAKQGPFVRILRMGTETLAGIPSIVFGLFGRIFFVKILGLGIGFLSSTLTVTLMILPTLVRTSEEALKAVPKNLREGSLAMGATRFQTIMRVVIPAASPGILTGIILAVGRVVGETAILLYTLGSGYDLVRNLSSPARVLSLHLYLLFSEAVSFDRAFATATVLIFMVLITNLLTKKLIRKQSVYS
ncbi:MAG: phosphate ABC transporter permease PstA [Spirochaetaceae bacterium]|jgi:phosphate transport system permease protein|nr:phosphate ABC transporter permease PstA [Spirochaetaceae bacterium]